MQSTDAINKDRLGENMALQPKPPAAAESATASPQHAPLAPSTSQLVTVYGPMLHLLSRLRQPTCGSPISTAHLRQPVVAHQLADDGPAQRTLHQRQEQLERRAWRKGGIGR